MIRASVLYLILQFLPGVWLSAFADVPAAVDLASFNDQGLQQLDTCLKAYEPDATTASGHTIKMLGVAFVYMSPSNGRSIFGHVGERFVYCRDDQRYDAFYDYAPLTREQIDAGPDDPINDRFRPRFASFTAEEKKDLVGSLFVNLSFKPANDYHFRQSLRDETVQEAWLETDGQTMYKMLVANTDRYRDQASKVASHDALPRYKLLSADCLTPVKQDMSIVNPQYLVKNDVAGLTPSFYYGYLKKQRVKQIIVYPSQTLFRYLSLKGQGKQSVVESIVPLSHSLKGAFGKSWVLFYETGGNAFSRFLLRPLTGVANLALAGAEVLVGIAEAPFSRKRIQQAVFDVVGSASEMLDFEIRYPVATQWTAEERQFFKDMTQQSALLEFLEAEWDHAPVVVQANDQGVPSDK